MAATPGEVQPDVSRDPDPSSDGSWKRMSEQELGELFTLFPKWF